MNVSSNGSVAAPVSKPNYWFGALMRAYRMTAGRTQAAVATELGVSPPRVNAIECGRSVGPEEQLVQRLESFLHLTADQVTFMRDVATRDKVLHCAVRSGWHAERVCFLSACLDAAVEFTPQELPRFRDGIAAQVVARGRAAKLLGQPSLSDAIRVAT
jgi:transcriptional regulator with XRE-family HTH domain